MSLEGLEIVAGEGAAGEAAGDGGRPVDGLDVPTGAAVADVGPTADPALEPAPHLHPALLPGFPLSDKDIAERRKQFPVLTGNDRFYLDDVDLIATRSPD